MKLMLHIARKLVPEYEAEHDTLSMWHYGSTGRDKNQIILCCRTRPDKDNTYMESCLVQDEA